MDFGIAGLHAGLKSEPTNAGSLNYMAPELFTKKQSNASPALDVWSLGCILYAMVTGNLPFRGDKSQDLKHKIINDPITFPASKNLSEEIQHLIRRTMDKNPETRASIFEITDHAWTNGRQFSAEEKEKIKQQEMLFQAQAKEAALKEKLEEEASNNPSPNPSGSSSQYSNSPKKFSSIGSTAPPANSKFRSFGNLNIAPNASGEKKAATPTAAGTKKPSTTPSNGQKPSGGHK